MRFMRSSRSAGARAAARTAQATRKTPARRFATLPRPAFRRAFAPIVLVSLGLAAVAQTDPAPAGDAEPKESKLEERVDVTLVQLNFIAVDGRGRPISDLRPEEIVIRDRGEKQDVAFLEAYDTGGGPRLPEADAERPTSETGESPEEPRPATAPSSPGRWLVLYFDNFLSDQVTKLHSIEAAREFIEREMTPRDNVAIVSFTGKFRLVQPFTNDAGLLSAALGDVLQDVDQAQQDRYSLIDDLFQQLELCADGPTPWSCGRKYGGAFEFDRRREATMFLTTLNQVVRSISAIPETKIVVLFSNGFTRNPTGDVREVAKLTLGLDNAERMFFGQDFRIDRLFDDLAAAAAEAKVSVFTINPGGASRIGRISAEHKGLYDESQYPTNIDPWRHTELNHQAGLSEIARRTGGRSTQSSNIGQALSRIVDVSSGLYSVGFYPKSRLPKSVHDVKIKVLRKGVKALTRKEVPRVLRHPPLVFDLAVEPGACDPSGKRPLEIAVRVDLEDLRFEVIEEEVHSNFALFTRFTNPDGERLLHQRYRFFNVHYPKKEYDPRGLPDPEVAETLVVPCGEFQIEVTATDANSGAKGRVTHVVPPA